MPVSLQAGTCLTPTIMMDALDHKDFTPLFTFVDRKKALETQTPPRSLLYAQKETKNWTTITMIDEQTACVNETGTELEYISRGYMKAALGDAPKLTAPEEMAVCEDAIKSRVQPQIQNDLTFKGRSDDGSYLYVYHDGGENSLVFEAYPNVLTGCSTSFVDAYSAILNKTGLLKVFGYYGTGDNPMSDSGAELLQPFVGEMADTPPPPFI